ncbi:MAG TPA: hypothetical protein PKE45_03330 [Caldilineaceae bacterium]|nr:hypothetical protein [Caldilineaceae bacterium]
MEREQSAAPMSAFWEESRGTDPFVSDKREGKDATSFHSILARLLLHPSAGVFCLPDLIVYNLSNPTRPNGYRTTISVDNDMGIVGKPPSPRAQNRGLPTEFGAARLWNLLVVESRKRRTTGRATFGHWGVNRRRVT